MRPDDGFKIAKVDRQMAALTDPEAFKAALREVLRDELPRLLAEALERPAASEADLLDVAAAAKRLGLKPATVYKRAARIEIPSVKLGGRVLFKVADLDAYTEARRRA